ncbi:MAG: endonuclease III [Planctomycetaceae bacterium]|jgi:endonuclease-3|nr:endonuclease III [Planctomycetaceae bacterium]MDP7274441.1 endonuclease III [Planctomycetaceae bacterium]
MARSGCSVPNGDVKDRARKILRGLKRTYPDAECALLHDDAFQLLAATILSAQCTDERVNMVTPVLFEKYPTAEALATGRIRDIERIIKSTGFFRAKSKSLKGMAQGLVGEFGGELPRDVDQLVKLPGVGRKTANVVLGVCYRIASGVVVDTHVRRISNLLGLTSQENPEKIEVDLMNLLPKTQWIDFSHRIIHHGRKVCIARRPRCVDCTLLKWCPRVGLPPLEE